MVKAALFGNRPDTVGIVYGGGRRERIADLTDLYPEIVSKDNFAGHRDRLAGVEAVFSTWGMPALDDAELDALPNLKIVFYAASSVKHFAGPLLDRGIVVVSAWSINAICVAEFILGQILLANKGFFRDAGGLKAHGFGAGRPPLLGNFEETVSLLGLGQVGRRLVALLKPFALRVVAYDPYVGADEASALGVEMVSLEEAVERGGFVSNHIPGLPETRGLINGALLQRMRAHATFSHIANGPSLAWADVYGTFRDRPDLTALLDTADSSGLSETELKDLLALPNVWLSTHLAGAIGNETLRMTDALIEEFLAWQAGDALRFAVKADELKRMA
jgi:phosphoglycerate dehydrogenase-like enzyme